MIALLDVGENSRTEDAAADQQRKQTHASDSNRSVAVGVLVDEALYTNQRHTVGQLQPVA